MKPTPLSKRSQCDPAWAAVLSLGSLLAVLATPATAHDTWWAPTPEPAVLALGTGNRFPVQEFPLGVEQLQLQGCRKGTTVLPLQAVADMPTALWLRAPPGAQGCWAQTLPLDIQIDDVLVEAYFKEIAAGPAIRARRAEQRSRGVRWQERYVKHARIELDGADQSDSASPLHTAAVESLGLDVRLQAPRRPLRVGDGLLFQVLRDGVPLAGLPVELRSDLSPLGLWRTTDAQGMVSIALPLAARWVLRGVDLRPAVESPDRWESRFVTLAFEVKPMAATEAARVRQ